MNISKLSARNMLATLTAIVICAVMTTACSSNEEPILQPNATENTEIIYNDPVLTSVKLQLDSLNNATFSDINKSRGFRDWFKRVVAVVVSDAVGGMVGSVGGPVGTAVGAIGASAVAAFTPIENISFMSRSGTAMTESSSTPQMNPASISLVSSIIPASKTNVQISKEDSLGYYHNKALLSMNQSIHSDKIDFENILIHTADITGNLYHASQEDLTLVFNENRPLFDNIASEIVPLRNLEVTPLEIINLYATKYPNYQSELNVLGSFFEGLYNMDIDENDGEYMNKVLEIIQNASLDDNTKQHLRNAVIVGNASYQLWNVQ